MSPEQLKQFNQMQADIKKLMGATDVNFIENMRRRLDIVTTVDDAISNLTLNDISDVDVPSPTDGQVLKYTTTGTDRWVAGTDNTA